jgi:hypothetical protein
MFGIAFSAACTVAAFALNAIRPEAALHAKAHNKTRFKAH